MFSVMIQTEGAVCPSQLAAYHTPWLWNAFLGRAPALAVLLINFSAGTN